jgi:hypothetical protein
MAATIEHVVYAHPDSQVTCNWRRGPDWAIGDRHGWWAVDRIRLQSVRIEIRPDARYQDWLSFERDIEYVRAGGLEVEQRLRQQAEWDVRREEDRITAQRTRRRVEEFGVQYAEPAGGSYVREPYASYRWHCVRNGSMEDLGEGADWRRDYVIAAVCGRRLSETVAQGIERYKSAALERTDQLPEGGLCRHCATAAGLSGGITEATR